MTTSFIKDMMDEAKEKAANNPNKRAYKAGYLVGMTLVLAGVLTLEALFVAAVAGSLGIAFSWFQGLCVVLFVKWLKLNFIVK